MSIAISEKRSPVRPRECGWIRSLSPNTVTVVLRAALLAILSLVLAAPLSVLASAQSEAGSAAIEGTVTGADGKPVAGATVTARNVDTGYSRSLVTDRNGHYNAQVMPVGSYLITARAEQLAATAEGIELTVGTRKSVNLSLRQSQGTEGPVVVSADPGSLEREEMSTSASIGLRYIGDLPIRGRNFPEFVKLTPALIQESDRFGLVIAGQRSINSNIAIDGTDFNDPLQGNQRGGNEPVFFFPQSAVREFQVIRSGATAEVGRTNAGFVNVVTKSGTNNFHGEAFYFNRNKEFTSANAFGQSLNNKQNQFGGAFGGPIKQDRVFFFASAEQNFLTVPRFTQFKSQPAGVVIPPELAALEGEYPGTNNPTAVFARTDVTISNRDTLNVYYTYSRLTGENFNSEVTPDIAKTFNYTREGRSHGVRLGFTSVFSPVFLNEVRGQFATDDRAETPNLETSQVVIAGFGTVGSDASRPRVFNAHRFEVTDNLSVTQGIHQWRFGFDFNRNNVVQERITNLQGRYDFASLTDYANRKIDRYRQTFPASGNFDDFEFTGVQKELAFYVQDKIAFTPTLTLTAGLRWEGLWNPQPVHPNPALVETTRIPNDLDQWQPRLGLAWNVAGKGKTIVRLSAGLYDARTPQNLFQRN
ncbi:MAG TPA: TonB-dependent receptor, partial [Blastocatellia bacterium]|nr:TonB-dependent receptor [Blastocatellia bacterium]